MNHESTTGRTPSYPTWAHAAKDMVGTSLGSARLWFTVAEGIVTEVYYSRVAGLAAGETFQFTFYWRDSASWEGQDYEVLITA